MKTIIIITLLALFGTKGQAQPLLKTHVETGDVEGVLDGTDLAVYKAIPYAAPPVGELRWKAPQPANPWIYGAHRSGKRVGWTFWQLWNP